MQIPPLYTPMNTPSLPTNNEASPQTVQADIGLSSLAFGGLGLSHQSLQADSQSMGGLLEKASGAVFSYLMCDIRFIVC
jgi:hypothetical protein